MINDHNSRAYILSGVAYVITTLWQHNTCTSTLFRLERELVLYVQYNIRPMTYLVAAPKHLDLRSYNHDNLQVSISITVSGAKSFLISFDQSQITSATFPYHGHP